MDKKTVGLLGAVAGLATIGSAQAAISPASEPLPALQASSYADLLAPIPNAAALLKADDAAREPGPVSGGVQDAQYYYYSPYYYNPYYPPYNYYYPPYYYRHHHHHHHRYYYRRYRHHHHHAAFFAVPGAAGKLVKG